MAIDALYPAREHVPGARAPHRFQGDKDVLGADPEEVVVRKEAVA